MKRNASKRDERHGQSRHRPTKVLEFVKLILRPRNGRKSVSLSLFMEVNALLGGRCVDEQVEKGATEGVEEADLWSTDMGDW